MKYRLIVIFLLSLLFGSFSFNLLHYDALIRAESLHKMDNEYNKLVIQNFITQLNEATE
jgi:hypothetical protein